jgi:hypothetical protein
MMKKVQYCSTMTTTYRQSLSLPTTAAATATAAKHYHHPKSLAFLLGSNSPTSRNIVTYPSFWWCSSSCWNTTTTTVPTWTNVKKETVRSSSWNISLVSCAKFSTDTTKSSRPLSSATNYHSNHDNKNDNNSNDKDKNPTANNLSLVDWRFCKDNRPTLEYAKAMPRNFSAMSHEQILQLCAEGKYEARREALIRNVMAIDEIEYDAACEKVLEIAQENRNMMHWEYSPYHMVIFAALLSGGISFPLIFDKQTVLWFNRHFVTADVPDAADLETIWEIGSWSWGWMEPVIGQASFVLLVLQFARSQAMKLGMKPYGDAMLSWRSKRLVQKYPQYDAMFVEWFAESEAIYGNHKGKD